VVKFVFTGWATVLASPGDPDDAKLATMALP